MLINENNILKIKNFTLANEFHLSAQKFINSEMEFFNHNLCMGDNSAENEYGIKQTDNKIIRNIITLLKE